MRTARGPSCLLAAQLVTRTLCGKHLQPPHLCTPHQQPEAPCLPNVSLVARYLRRSRGSVSFASSLRSRRSASSSLLPSPRSSLLPPLFSLLSANCLRLAVCCALLTAALLALCFLLASRSLLFAASSSGEQPRVAHAIPSRWHSTNRFQKQRRACLGLGITVSGKSFRVLLLRHSTNRFQKQRLGVLWLIEQRVALQPVGPQRLRCRLGSGEGL